jgi:hypothetical protein
MTTVPSFAPTAAVEAAVSTTSARVAIPTTGSPTVVVVTNLSGQAVFVALGGSNVTVSAGGGVPVMPFGKLALTIGGNTYLAAITQAGFAELDLTVGV